MAKTRLVPNHQLTPALRGALVRYYSRGQWLAQSWPKKRGTPKSLKVQNQNNWFRDMVQLMKYAPERQQVIARQMAEKTGKYPHDIMMMAAAGNVYDIILPDGSTLEPYKPKVEKITMQGFRLRRTTPLNLAAGATTPIPWEIADIDTAGFWDISNPTQITIPTGVNAIFLHSQWLGPITAAAYNYIFIGTPTPTYYGVTYFPTTTGIRNSASTGVISVAPGLPFEVSLLSGVAQTLTPNQGSNFSGFVLDAS